jgi:hypothetical protein
MASTLRLYKRINARACNVACANGFKSDRHAGLIYGPFRYANGKFALTWEEASRNANFCAYCGWTPKKITASETTPQIYA